MEFGLQLLDIISLHFEGNSPINELAQLLNDLSESVQEQIIEIKKIESQQNEICLNITETLSKIIEEIDGDGK